MMFKLHLQDRGLDTRGVKTELVERLKAALEGESGEKETELEVDEEASLEGKSKEEETEIAVGGEAAEVDAEKPEITPAGDAGGGEHSVSGKQDGSEDVIEKNLSNTEAAGAIPEEDATVTESDPNMEEKTETVKDKREDVTQKESEREKNTSPEEEEKHNEVEGLTAETNPADQVAPIGLRELRPQSTDVLDFEPEEEEVLKAANENEEVGEETSEGVKTDGLNNVASPNRVPEKEVEDDEV